VTETEASPPDLPGLEGGALGAHSESSAVLSPRQIHHPDLALTSDLKAEVARVLDPLVDGDRRIAPVDFPGGHNVGDNAMWLGTLAYLASRAIEVEYVRTDRLHGHILRSLLGIPHRSMDNFYGNNRGFYQTWTNASRLARWIDSDDSSTTIISAPA